MNWLGLNENYTLTIKIILSICAGLILNNCLILICLSPPTLWHGHNETHCHICTHFTPGIHPKNFSFKDILVLRIWGLILDI